MLIAVAGDKSIRRTIDHDWITDLATHPASPTEELAGQVHALRVAAELHMSKRLGHRYRELTAAGAKAPLRAAAAGAWASTDDWGPGKAMDLLLDEGDLTTRRALVGGFQHRANHKKKAKDCARIERAEPDLAPTLAWAAAGR